jgi:hypothetical protein
MSACHDIDVTAGDCGTHWLQPKHHRHNQSEIRIRNYGGSRSKWTLTSESKTEQCVSWFVQAVEERFALGCALSYSRLRC